jgi:hypothetical protein
MNTASQTQHLRWLELAGLSRAASEFVILLAWYAALARPEASLGVSGLVLAGLMFTCFGLVRLVERQDLSTRQQNFIITLWVVVIAFASFQPTFYPNTSLTALELFTTPLTALLEFDANLREFWHLAILTLMAWRGIAAGRRLVTVQSTMKSLRSGLLLLLVFGAFHSHTLTSTTAITIMAAFFFFILVSLTAGRVAEVGEMRGGRIPRLKTGRGLGILTGALATSVIASLLGLFGAQVGGLVSALTLTVLALIAVVMLVLILPVLALTVWLLDQLPTFTTLETDMLSNAEAAQETVEAVTADLSQSVGLLTAAGRPFLMLVALIGLFGLIYLALRARARRPQSEIELDSEQYAPRIRFRIPSIMEALQQRTRLPGFGQAIAAARIRQTYKRMLLLCQRLGAPRPAGTTPSEFLPRIQTLFVEEDQAAATITHAYNKIRYGEYPEMQEEVQVVLEAWQQIERRGRLMLKQKKTSRQAVKDVSGSRWG